jgi:hypothetical protein
MAMEFGVPIAHQERIGSLLSFVWVWFGSWGVPPQKSGGLSETGFQEILYVRECRYSRGNSAASALSFGANGNRSN